MRGLCGMRAGLIPHQLYIAHEVGRRHAPRVLLADEVGLGKTIEAGMIIHQQVLSGRAERILIVDLSKLRCDINSHVRLNFDFYHWWKIHLKLFRKYARFSMPIL